MKSLPLLFLGIFFTLAFSWTGIVLSGNLQLGRLEPVSSELLNAEGDPIQGIRYATPEGRIELGRTNLQEVQWPRIPSGMAEQGKAVYTSLGCVYCHSQQVSRRGFRSDFERGWGDRQSVPRDYIRQERVLLGTSRTGPDLMTAGQRIADVNWHMLHLYNPRITSRDSIMPSFTYLFEEREIGVEGPSPNALRLRKADGSPISLANGDPLPAKYVPRDGHEIVPTERGAALVAYLLSLRLDYELPEAKFAAE